MQQLSSSKRNENVNQVVTSLHEPLFIHHGYQLTEDMMQEMYATLVKKNNDSKMDGKGNWKYPSHSKIVECVFLLCDHFRQHQETRYIAIQLYERFVTAKSDDFFYKLSQTNETQNFDDKWKTALSGKLKRNVFAYVLACCQIAGKICCHQQVIPNTKSSHFIEEVSGPSIYVNEIKKDIVGCEREILQAVNYELPFTTILTFTEVVLEILGTTCGISTKDLYHICLKVIELVQLRRSEIFDKLYELTVERNSHGPTGAVDNINDTATKGRIAEGRTLTRSKFAIVEKDDLFLAAAVIETAAYISMKEKHPEVLTNLSRLTHIPVDDIVDLSSVLVELALSALTT